MREHLETELRDAEAWLADATAREVASGFEIDLTMERCRAAGYLMAITNCLEYWAGMTSPEVD